MTRWKYLWMDWMWMGNYSQRPFLIKCIIEKRFQTMGWTRKHYKGSRRHISSLLQMWISRGEITLRQEVWNWSWQVESQSGTDYKSKLLQRRGACSDRGVQKKNGPGEIKNYLLPNATWLLTKRIIEGYGNWVCKKAKLFPCETLSIETLYSTNDFAQRKSRL